MSLRVRIQSYTIFGSIFGNTGINFIRPGKNSAFEIVNLAEACFAQKIHGFGGAFSTAAMRNNFAGRIEFMDPARQFTQWQQMSLNVANLIFVRLAYVENV